MLPSNNENERLHPLEGLVGLLENCISNSRHHAILFPVESIFSEDLDGVFQKMIDVVCKETSLHLLDVLNNKYKFMEHLKAMRRYLLLGQGDFIRHLMDLLE